MSTEFINFIVDHFGERPPALRRYVLSIVKFSPEVAGRIFSKYLLVYARLFWKETQKVVLYDAKFIVPELLRVIKVRFRAEMATIDKIEQ